MDSGVIASEDKEKAVAAFGAIFYNHIFRRGVNSVLNPSLKQVKWRGVNLIKMPSDLILYQQVIWEKKPDFIIECGTAFGGSALFFGDMLNMVGNGRVISIDIAPRSTPEHPRVKYIVGSTVDPAVVAQVAEIVAGKTCMVVLDSSHERRHVKRELRSYYRMVTRGQYIVVEDINYRRYDRGPGPAVDWFLGWNKRFVRENIEEQFLIKSVTSDGWLRRR
jgi:cephalosporin hydroxylase